MDIAATSNSALYSLASVASQPPMDTLASIPSKSIQVPKSTSTSQGSPSDNQENSPQKGEAANGALRQGAEKLSSSEQQTQQEVQRVISELKSRDREVKAHEQAHLAAGGRHVTGGASYSYQTGPDGQRYAVGGEVGIDTSPVSGDPEATLSKAQQIRAAALAPAEPSSQDLKVAAQATQMAAQARAEIAQKNQQERTGDGSEVEPSDKTAKTDRSQMSLQSNPLLAASQEKDRLAMSSASNNPLLTSAASERNQFEIRLMGQAS
ncbi:hypothetical protein AVO42_12225 [Thiomicrospira sp. XS5]|uniref:putative metalloprotease CJM1_0395 family protein n=1 Tax=Thiomicrospira sp. XS5 TaxID=1775636 RepID=UPI00074860C7|nr:putative metalloprotease CJM1_0395 family protein [Thiomicrospira sp. XS5]KUJ73576.1 hypothetical protein AVO42_12225 [Thiomicrospira sp. XS5]